MAFTDTSQFGVKDVLDLTLFDIVTKKPVLRLETLKMSAIENEADTVEARGGQGNGLLMNWELNRRARLQCQNALLSPKAVAMQAGTELRKDPVPLYRVDKNLVARAGSDVGKTKVTLSKEPIDGSIKAFLASDDCGTELAFTTDAGKKSLEFDSADVAENEQVVVYYQFMSSGNVQVVSVASDKFGGVYEAVGHTLVQNEDRKFDAFQIHFYRAKIVSNFNIQMQADGDPAVFDFNFELQQVGPNDKRIYDMIRYEDKE